MANTILLTGATGFLGQWILHQELEETDDDLILPVRAADDEEARERIDRLLEYRFGGASSEHRRRIDACAATLDRPDIGLSERARERIVTETTHMIHAAADIRWTLPTARIRAVNVGGTAAMWDLAAQARSNGTLERALFTSTVGIAGRTHGIFYESERDIRQRFHNSYERTKFEAEHMVERMQSSVPAVVARIGAIVGEASTGVTESWDAMYYVLRLYGRYARLGLRVFPTTADRVSDCVPVDWTARACRALVGERDAAGLTVHLAQGFDRAPTLREFVRDGSRALGLAAPIFVPLSLVTPFEMTGLRLMKMGGPMKRRARAADAYLAYGREAGAVDCTAARRLLGRHGLEAPAWDEFKEPVLRYMARTNFGRKAPETYPERRRFALEA